MPFGHCPISQSTQAVSIKIKACCFIPMRLDCFVTYQEILEEIICFKCFCQLCMGCICFSSVTAPPTSHIEQQNAESILLDCEL